jgi:hypothetical protein
MCLAFVGCAGELSGVTEEEREATEFGDPEEPEEGVRSPFAYFPTGTKVEVCNTHVGLNNRSGPGTKYRVLRLLPNGARATTTKRSGSWYRLDLESGGSGWSYYRYLCKVSSSSPSPSPTPSPTPSPSPGFGVSRDGIINTAKVYVGFSYWWGGAKLPNPWDNPQSKPKGKCYSSSYKGHSGSYGADCSGYVGKVWHLPPALPFTSNKHPYSTYSFYHNKSYWSHISRSSTKRADAMVYRGSKGGHIVIYEKGDPWGSVWTYEARGCSYGVRHNLRTLSSSYRSRRRNGV